MIWIVCIAASFATNRLISNTKTVQPCNHDAPLETAILSLKYHTLVSEIVETGFNAIQITDIMFQMPTLWP